MYTRVLQIDEKEQRARDGGEVLDGHDDTPEKVSNEHGECEGEELDFCE